ncbi:MAG: nickel pincer cofactor biosynthesis protein LarB [Planctomycetes bacterium]|nr:nickel pincer cofactor biosynthesis protein LarB [Planctomycetota bacterium]
MGENGLREILEALRDGRLDVEGALRRLSSFPVRDLGHTQLDTQRELRCGGPEVVYGAGKTPEQVLEISVALLEHHDRLLVTRIAPEAAELVRRRIPRAVHDARARALYVEPEAGIEQEGLVLVVCAGTSDLPVADEAALTARLMGARVERLQDVGVAGIHRLLAHTERLREARALVVVAGMEGALPSVVGGLVSAPVIAVPTSVGYGASFGGIAALLAMLNSCAAGIAVVNIDNGFGAGVMAARINAGARSPIPEGSR